MMRAIFRRFFRAREGVAAVEFALIAPMMIVVLFGAIEITNMVQSNQRVENTAISLADVISRDTEVSNAELTGMWSAVSPLMFPDTATGMNVRVTSISIDAQGKGWVVWSEVCSLQAHGACGGSSYTKIAVGASVPAGELPAQNTPGSSLIRVEASFDYRPLIGLFSINAHGGLSHDGSITNLSHTAFRRSRLVDPIPRV